MSLNTQEMRSFQVWETRKKNHSPDSNKVNMNIAPTERPLECFRRRSVILFFGLFSLVIIVVELFSLVILRLGVQIESATACQTCTS